MHIKKAQKCITPKNSKIIVICFPRSWPFWEKWTSRIWTKMSILINKLYLQNYIYKMLFIQSLNRDNRIKESYPDKRNVRQISFLIRNSGKFILSRILLMRVHCIWNNKNRNMNDSFFATSNSQNKDWHNMISYPRHKNKGTDAIIILFKILKFDASIKPIKGYKISPKIISPELMVLLVS